MATYTKIPLSGATDFRGIKVTTVGPVDGSDTTIHTAQASATLPDVVTLFGYNSDTVARWVELGWGGTTSPDDLFRQTIPAASGMILLAELPIRNSLVVVAAAEVANKIIIFGYVNRISA